MTLYEITQKIQADLAQVSASLVASGGLTENVRVIIQDDVMHYDEIMEISSQRIVPCVLKVDRSFINDAHFSETLNAVLWFYTPIEKRDSLYTLLDEYRQLENDEKHELVDGQLVTKTVQRYRFDEYKRAQDGLDDFMFVLRLDFTWLITDEYMSGKHAVLEVKTGSDVSYTEIPFATHNMTNTKSYVSNASEGVNEYLTDDTLILNLPLSLTNAKIAEMYDDVDNNSYNKIYTFRLTIGAVEKVKQLVLKQGQYIIENSNKIVGLTLTFGAKYDRAVIQIDDVSLKVVNYQYSGLTEGTAKRDGDTNKSDFKSLSRTWRMTIVDDNSSKYDELYNEVYDGDYITHVLKVVKGSTRTYNVRITKGSEGFTETQSSLTIDWEET